MENPEENVILQRWASQDVATNVGQQTLQNNSNKRRRIADALGIYARSYNSPAPSIEEIMPIQMESRVEPIRESQEVDSPIASGLCRLHGDSDSARAFLDEVDKARCKEQYHDGEALATVTTRIVLKSFMQGLKRRNFLAWKYVVEDCDRQRAVDRRAGYRVLSVAECNKTTSLWEILCPLKRMRSSDQCFLCVDPDADIWALRESPPGSPQ